MSSADSAESKDFTLPVSTIPNPIESRAVTDDSTAKTAVPENPRPNTLFGAKPPSPPQPVVSSNTPTLTSAPSVTTTVSTFNKSKKKKSPVSMTASNSTQSSIGPQGENTGRWTAEEHRLFLQGLDQHGKGWKKIASLIKSRTVVQIRTHAQKYFQKLAKARQNGDEGEIPMDTGRVGPVITTSTSGIPTVVAHSGARRRQATGTKRKAIASVVKSATRQGKKMAAALASAGGAPPPVPPLPSVAPALAPFLPPEPPSNPAVPSMSTAHGTISGPAFEDSLFRFLTPVPVTSDPPGQVNDVARQVGANPITLPSDNPSTAPSAPGDISPTGVTDYALYPSWNDVKDLPNWYSKGADVDCLLEVADNLDWLADSGDLHETYEPPKSSMSNPDDDGPSGVSKTPSIPGLNSDALGGSLPTLLEPTTKKAKLSSTDIAGSPDGMEDHLQVFDEPMDEHAFVSALLENNCESSASLPNLG